MRSFLLLVSSVLFLAGGSTGCVGSDSNGNSNGSRACRDADRDGVCDTADVCPNGSDTIDSDSDGVMDGCDLCPGANDAVDTDGDSVPDGCDACEGHPDDEDADADGRPDACEPHPVVDVNTTPNSARPRYFTIFDGVLYFQAEDNLHGVELWRSDGTVAGTYMLKDIKPGDDASYPANLTVSGSRLFFTARNETNRTVLYATDGTADGTVMVKNINPDAYVGFDNFVAFEGGVLFTADHDVTGEEPWFSDGTEAGTVMLGDITEGSGGSFPGNFAVIGSNAYFRASDGTSGSELWVTDGTPGGTTMAFDLWDGGSSSPNHLVAVGSTLYFGADDGTGDQLWQSDGTEGGTSSIGAMEVRSIAVADTKLFIHSWVINEDPQLWTLTFEGVLSSPVTLDNIASINYTYGDLAIFTAIRNPGDGFGLFASDGTDPGTIELAHVTSSGLPGAELGERFYFLTTEANQNALLYESDGTLAGTKLIKDMGPAYLGAQLFNVINFDSWLYFAAEEPDVGVELHRSDGTADGTGLFLDIRTETADARIDDAKVVDGHIYFGAHQGDAKGGAFVTDGTAANTVLLADPHPGVDSEPRGFVEMGSHVYFTARTDFMSTDKYRLWRTDGTPGGTEMVSPVAEADRFSEILPVGNVLYFVAQEFNGLELWKSDGTSGGTIEVKDILVGGDSNPEELTELGGTLYFFATGPEGLGLWTSDGTTGGTTELLGFSDARNLTVWNGELWFIADDGAAGMELWHSDGTVGGTEMFDLEEGAESSWPGRFTPLGGELFFSASSPTTGSALWRTDGTLAGTEKIWQPSTDPEGGMGRLVSMGGYLYTTVSVVVDSAQEIYEIELWLHSGVPGSELKITTLPDWASQMFATDTLIFMVIDSEQTGRELWRTDGTADGTYMEGDLVPGPIGSEPTDFLEMNGDVYFIARHELFNRELWVMPP